MMTTARQEVEMPDRDDLVLALEMALYDAQEASERRQWARITQSEIAIVAARLALAAYDAANPAETAALAATREATRERHVNAQGGWS